MSLVCACKIIPEQHQPRTYDCADSRFHWWITLFFTAKLINTNDHIFHTDFYDDLLPTIRHIFIIFTIPNKIRFHSHYNKLINTRWWRPQWWRKHSLVLRARAQNFYTNHRHKRRASHTHTHTQTIKKKHGGALAVYGRDHRCAEWSSCWECISINQLNQLMIASLFRNLIKMINLKKNAVKAIKRAKLGVSMIHAPFRRARNKTFIRETFHRCLLRECASPSTWITGKRMHLIR